MNFEYQKDLVSVNTKKIVSGPTVILQDTRDNILVVFEAEQKDWKKIGQIFVPTGAKEQTDNNMEAAAIREVREETGIEDLDPFYLQKKGEIFLEGEKYDVNAHVYLYQKKLPTNILKDLKHSHSHEITNKVFMDIKKILSLKQSSIRPGLYEILANGLLSKYINYNIHFEKGEYKKDDSDVKNTYQELFNVYNK